MADYGPHNMFQHVFVDGTSALIGSHALEVAAGDLDQPFVVAGAPITITRFGIFVTVAFAYDTQTAEGIVSLDRRVTYGSDTGRVEIETVNLTDTTALGKSIYVDCATDCDVGDQIMLEAKVAATGGGGIAGDWFGYFCYTPRAQTPANMADLVATT